VISGTQVEMPRPGLDKPDYLCRLHPVMIAPAQTTQSPSKTT
jgi:hypothetical protein